MKVNPLVTVGVASYNNAKYVVETLNSIVAQTYQNIELVVVDDCSTDNSVDVIKDFIASCPLPTKLLVNERNAGVVAVCNRLLSEVHGQYYCLVGSDDVFYSNKIALQVRAITEGKGDMVFSSMNYVDAVGQMVSMPGFNQLPHHSGPFVLTWAFLLGGSFITAPTVMLRTSVAKQVGGYDPAYTIEDMPFWIKLAKTNAKMFFIDEPLVNYRVYSASLSTRLTTLISHARLVAGAAKQMRGSDRWRVQYFMWYRIVSNHDSNAVIPPIPRSETLYWICTLNRTRIGHFLLYRFLNKKVNQAGFIERLKTIRKQVVFGSKNTITET